MKSINYAFASILLLLFAVGCGGQPSVKGKVAFPDGTPMGVGVVIFESETNQAMGALQEDGTYSMTAGDRPGLPEGTYRVFFSGYGPVYESVAVDRFSPPVMQISHVVECPIAEKFLNINTAGLTCVVKKGKTTFNITVEKP